MEIKPPFSSTYGTVRLYFPEVRTLYISHHIVSDSPRCDYSLTLCIQPDLPSFNNSSGFKHHINMPESSRRDSNRNNGSRSSRSKPATYKCLVWSCCSCGKHGPMDCSATLACVGHECLHTRCVNCPTEWVKRLVDEPDYRGEYCTCGHSGYSLY